MSEADERKKYFLVTVNDDHKPLRPYCCTCGWRKGGPDSWDGVACKCGHQEPPMKRIDEP